jgi:hypothetical protein
MRRISGSGDRNFIRTEREQIVYVIGYIRASLTKSNIFRQYNLI